MLYVPGLLTGQLSGSAGSTWATTNPYGGIVTVKRRRRGSSTTITITQRANFSALMILYKSLSSSDFQAWAAFAQTYQVTGKLGRSYHLDSAAAFIQINRNLHVLGLPPNTTPPAYVVPPPVTSVIVTATTSGGSPSSLSLDFLPDPTDSDTYLVIQAAQPRSQAQLAYPKASWKQIAVLPPSSSSPFDALADFLTRYPTFVAGQALSFKVIPISSEGIRGAGYLATGVAT